MHFNLDTPQFWRIKNSIISWLLWPISIIYQAISQLRYIIQTPEKIKKPIICIGNATVGGSGKTPVAIALATFLQKHKYKIAFVCKNYNASIKHPIQVTQNHTSSEIIDEAMLLAEIAPTYIAQSRLEAIKLAAQTKTDIIIVDDGLQNNSFYKDLSILVIDQTLELKNDFLFPAGPFRETLSKSASKSDVIFYINPKEKNVALKKYYNIKTTFKLPKKNKKQYIAFTGIAFPEKFFNALENLGISLKQRITFPDHHHYQDKDITELVSQSTKENTTLITTAKDMVKIPNKYKKNIDVLSMSLEIQKQDSLLKIIKDKCKKL